MHRQIGETLDDMAFVTTMPTGSTTKPVPRIIGDSGRLPSGL
jgi:hypothetical protein